MKRVAAFLLVLCMVVTLIPSVAMAKESDVNTTTDSTNSTTNSTYNDTDGTDTDSKSISTKTDSSTNSTTNSTTNSKTNSTTNTTNSTSNSTTNSTNSTSNSTSNSTTNSTKNLSDEEKEKYPEFTPLPYIIDGVVVNVSAPAGVFPKGAILKVTKVDGDSKKISDEAVTKINDKNKITAKSYTYDIKVYDKDGKTELQPKDGANVNVSFKSAEVADTNLNTEVYHINEEIIPEDKDKTDNKDDNLNLAKLDPNYVVDESRRVKLSAEQLIVLEDKDIDKAAVYSSSVLSDAIKDNRTAVVESSSFSTYIVNFTYDRMNYHMYNKTSMTAGEIRDLMSKTGPITKVISSDNTKLKVSGSYENATIAPNEAITADDGVVLTLMIEEIYYAINITASVNDQDITIVDVTTWQGLQDAINNYTEGSIIRLTSDVTCDNNERLDVNEDDNKNVVIDLNGHAINRNLEENEGEDGHVMQVHKGSLTITDSTGTKGQIKKGYAKNGGGIYIKEDATVTINGGTITENQAKTDGGAIYCKGVLIMNGGIISSNSAYDTGGAIYVEDNSNSKIELHNVDISSNNAENKGGAFNLHIGNDSIIDNCIFSYNKSNSDFGGAIYMDADSRLTINNTAFNENKSDDDGGAIYLEDGTIEMTKGSFDKNESQNDSGAVKVTDDTTFKANGTKFEENRSVTEEGGAIKNASYTELVNCTFTSNMSQKEGGAIWSDDNLVITGCIFKNNESAYKGGAIYSDDELTITGTDDNPTQMTENSCQKGNGGAIFVGGSSEDVNIAGKIIIMDNSAKDGNNIYLRDDRVLKTTDKILEGSEIHLTAEDEMGVVVKNFGTTNPIEGTDFDSGPHKFFKSDNGLGVRRKDNDVELHSGWAKLQDDINAAADGAEIDVYGDFSASSDEDSITIPDGKQIILDLNGHTLNRNLTGTKEHGHVIDVNKGRLTIIDSSAR